MLMLLLLLAGALIVGIMVGAYYVTKDFPAMSFTRDLVPKGYKGRIICLY